MSRLLRLKKGICYSSNKPSEIIVVDDINVKVQNKIGDEMEDDTSCHRKSMLSARDYAGNTVRLAYH